MPGIDGDTRIILHCNESDENFHQYLSDESMYNHSVSLVGDAVVNQSVYKFGNAISSGSIQAVVGGAQGYGYVQITNAADMCFPYWCRKTVDFWFKASAQTGPIYFWKGPGDAYILRVVAGGLVIRDCAPIPGFGVYLDDTWHHLALCIAVDGDPTLSVSITVYVDGIFFSMPSCTALPWISIASYSWHLCEISDNTGSLYMDEFRFSDATRYDANFIPEIVEYDPYSSAPYNYINNYFPVMTSVLYSGAYVLDVLPILVGLTAASFHNGVLSGTFCSLTSVLQSGAHVNAILPKLNATAVLSVSTRGNFLGTLPELNESGMYSGIVNAGILPNLSASIHALVGASINANQVLPNLQGNIVASTGVLITASANLSPLTGRVHSYEDISVIATAVFPVLNGTVQSGTSIIGNINETFIALIGTVQAFVTVKSSILAVFPSLQTEVFTVTVNYETFCLNLLKPELVSKFLNYNFNSYMAIDNKIYGCAQSGLFLLEGDSDNAVKIISRFSFPMLDFGSYLKKKVYGFNIGGRLSGDIIVSVNNGVRTWTTTLSKILTGFQRGYFNNDTMGDYLTFSITNSKGNAFTITAMDLYLMFLES